MKVKKSQLEVLQKALMGTENVLNFTEARVRDAFLKAVVENYQTYSKDRDKLLNSLAIPLEDKPNHYTLTPEFIKEEEVLKAEEVELPNEPKIKEFLEKTEYKPKIGEADVIDDLIKLF